jgi:hypothetical protein
MFAAGRRLARVVPRSRVRYYASITDIFAMPKTRTIASSFALVMSGVAFLTLNERRHIAQLKLIELAKQTTVR